MVRVVRAFRPDVILTLPLEGPGGGQHHQAAGQLAREAFRAAADPARFPSSSEGLRPWQARKIYQGGVGGFGGGAPAQPRPRADRRLRPAPGHDVAAARRARARDAPLPGGGPARRRPRARRGRFTLVDASRPSRRRESDILDGVDTTLAGLARFAPRATSGSPRRSRALTAQARRGPGRLRPARRPRAAVPPLAAALAAVRALAPSSTRSCRDAAARAELDGRLRDEEADAEAALALAHGLVLEARADDGLVTPGQSLGVARRALRQRAPRARGRRRSSSRPRAGWTVERRDGEAGPLAGGAARAAPRSRSRLPPTRAPSQPYWRRLKDRDRNELARARGRDPARGARRPSSRARALPRGRRRHDRFARRSPGATRAPSSAGSGATSCRSCPPVGAAHPEIAAVPLAGPRRPLEVRAFGAEPSARGRRTAERAARGCRRAVTVEPRVAPSRSRYEGEEAGARFRVTPPASLRPARSRCAPSPCATAARRASACRRSTTTTSSAGSCCGRPRRASSCSTCGRRPGASVGYVMGSGDAVADAIRQLGVPLTLLTADDLLFADLSPLHDDRDRHPRLRDAAGPALVPRAAHALGRGGRPPRRAVQPRRLQPPRPRGAAPPGRRPEPVRAVTRPRHRRADQRRDGADAASSSPGTRCSRRRTGSATPTGRAGCRSAGSSSSPSSDPRYHELLAATDPFPYNPGEKRGLLVDARVGKGSWTYVGLALFRQVPAGVPGGWRLLANLVSGHGRPRLRHGVWSRALSRRAERALERARASRSSRASWCSKRKACRPARGRAVPIAARRRRRELEARIRVACAGFRSRTVYSLAQAPCSSSSRLKSSSRALHGARRRRAASPSSRSCGSGPGPGRGTRQAVGLGHPADERERRAPPRRGPARASPPPRRSPAAPDPPSGSGSVQEPRTARHLEPSRHPRLEVQRRQRGSWRLTASRRARGRPRS